LAITSAHITNIPITENGGGKGGRGGEKREKKGRRGKKGRGRGKILIPGFRSPNSPENNVPRITRATVTNILEYLEKGKVS
jgi:hypothetical protein